MSKQKDTTDVGKTNSAKGKSKGNRSGNSFTLYIPEDVDRQLEDFRVNQLVPPNKKDIVVAAIREFLKNHQP